MAKGLSAESRRLAGIGAFDDPSMAGGGVEKQGPIKAPPPRAVAPSLPKAPVPVSSAPSVSGVGAAVSAPQGGSLPIASQPPSIAGLETMSGGGAPSEGAAPHQLSGPTTGRMNIGSRMPPSLAALLKYRVY